MEIIDLVIFIIYMIVMLGVGIYFLKSNKTADDYYVGGRKIGPWHVGLSVVATDVGGGFSIGLGGLGFTMGLSGSWMLFTGLIGAWLAAVFLIPKINKLAHKINLLTFPQVFGHFYGKNVAIVAGIISAVGYLGFTASQILAGAKLAGATFSALDTDMAIYIMGGIAVIYTVMGGLKAVIYTDTIQWILLMSGLIFIGIPMSYSAVGGYDAIVESINPELLTFTNITWVQIVNWAITIIPIWFVGMTLYQRIYACKDVKDAKKAWFIAGLFEWPIMALMGTVLGLLARVALDQGLFVHEGFSAIGDLDSEKGLPLLLKTILPPGLMGLMMSAYFSAIMSTADSCLMAASGNIVTDLIGNRGKKFGHLKLSQLATLIIGALSIFIALSVESVLDTMLLSYGFMVSGLFVPVLGALFTKRVSATASLVAMISGGLTTVILEQFFKNYLPFGLDANIYGILVSAILFIFITIVDPKTKIKTL
ncbi:sodium:solute symporter family protein [Marinigracilibium pacificum]|uniref:Sodium:solute symporter family protein n=1 Tax=Marinigracilibium pacificum TaxID=2729599 RepID=A0A848IUX1_9BACT|nr:sodium:solute symporter family protein [Marinigracilibium pacificum]NMM46988.1 sodium:solute symporter family protein [Marinigracilibium pacificum]